jgi:transcriptional regulator with XRE-family HTH domain
MSCPETPDGRTGTDGRTARGASAMAQQDPQFVFQQEFGSLVKASGLSIRDLEKRTGVRRSTLDGWKNGRSLPQELRALIKVVRTLQAAAEPGVDHRFSEQKWRMLLSSAKQARDDQASRQSLSGQNRSAGVAAERRARSIDATTAAMAALGELRGLGSKPDWEHEVKDYLGKDTPGLTTEAEWDALEKWEKRRADLIGKVRLAALDIEDPDLRGRLDEAVHVLDLWRGPMRHTRQPESRTRFLAATDALEALGAYRRGDLPPERGSAYRDTKGYADIYLDELEMNSGH